MLMVVNDYWSISFDQNDSSFVSEAEIPVAAMRYYHSSKRKESPLTHGKRRLGFLSIFQNGVQALFRGEQ
ncbi:hypothetical protein [Thalassoglobus sp.]|uniref:hypothetical protein n=1 Tax=Thalassoglobus sp. TaxID=2795869 RepID=UPI003AA87FF8